MGALTASQYMYGDEKRIEQVISNLLSCALNMTEKGDMIICNMDARQSSVTGSDIRFRVKISDNGCGISPEDKRMLFVPFIKTRFGKAGNMGLAIANRLVQIMGDAPIDTESSVGVGTVFRLSMQLAGINMPGIPALGMPPHKTALARSNIRVLLVEDMPQIRMVIKRSLTSIGIGTVDTCTNGKEAVDLVCGDGAEKYDCLFMDYFMPEMDGIEATKQIRKLLGAEAAPPIVGLTGDDAKNTADRFPPGRSHSGAGQARKGRPPARCPRTEHGPGNKPGNVRTVTVKKPACVTFVFFYSAFFSVFWKR